jgi:ferrochelatase
MAQHSDYVVQLRETCGLIAERVERDDWQLVYQSRSGSPRQPWLEPDVLAVLRELAAQGVTDVVVSPVGFISDHMEVLYDLDTEAQQLAGELGINLVRAGTAGTHPAFVSMIRQLIEERIYGADRLALGERGANHDACPEDCCLLGSTELSVRPTMGVSPSLQKT